MHSVRSLAHRILVTALLASLLPVAALAYDPPAGGSLVPILPSAAAIPYGTTATALDAPWADWLNPAASAGQQRPVLDASLVGISDFSSQGYGAAASLGLSLPTPYAVWGGGLRLITTPSAMSDLPLGTMGQAHATIAKDLFPNFYVGAGLGLTLGTNGGSGWGAGLDLGIIHKLGDVGLFKELRWGATFTNIGKGYETPSPATGLNGGSASAYPPPFAFGLGARALLIRTADVKAGIGLDFSVPTFADLITTVSTSFTWRDVVGLRFGWGFSALELSKGNARSFMPAIGLSATIPLQSGSKQSLLAKQGFESADLKPALTVAPLYGKLWAMGIGASLPMGSAAKVPPRIVAKFPSSSYGPAYISPNNDGIQDLLEIPVRITAPRYIVGWTFTIKDDKGKDVRKIFNKESRPEGDGFKGLWDRLVYVKKGVPIPDKLVWNGVADSGQVVSDGNYSAFIEAVDDNGNRGAVGPFPVVVKVAPPAAQVSFAESPPIFSPDGDGNKDSLLIKQTGTAEDLWKARVLDAAGGTARTVEYKALAPADFGWDGSGDDGKVVPDGVYSYVITATDRAGNTTTRRLDNIIINTQQPPVNVVIDLAAFSPNADGVKDSETLFPVVPVRSGLVSWRLSVLDASKREVWFTSGQGTEGPKERYSFDGRGTDLKTLSEGKYSAQITVTYLNGYTTKALSPAFVLDITAPSGSVTADRPAFNPAGAAGQNSVQFSQKAAKEAKWTAEVLGAEGKAVRTWAYSPLPEARIEWDGTDDGGKPVPDGVYTYRLRALDGAGNSFTSNTVSVSLDTEKKAVRLLADLKAFSSLIGAARNRLTLSSQVQGNDKVKSYELSISAQDVTGLAAGSVVRTWKDSRGVPETFTWDGSTDSKGKAPDGRYLARISVAYLNGDTAESQAGPFLLDSVPPSIQVSAEPLLFSPTEGSRKKTVTFSQKSLPGDDWEGRLVSTDGTLIRTWNWKGQAGNFSWDGTDEAGNLVKDGGYRYEVASTDAAGNKGTGAIPYIAVDKRPTQVFVTASATSLSPTGDADKRSVVFTLIVKLREGIDSWHFALVDKDGVERSVYGGQGGDIPSKIVWDGRDTAGNFSQGEYTGVFNVDYAKGDHPEARTAKILVNTEGPKAEVKITPDIFSPDDYSTNNELHIGLAVKDLSEIATWKFEIFEQAVVEGAPAGGAPNQRSFMSWEGTGTPTSLIAWDGRSSKGELVESATDYPFTFTASDVLGNPVRVDGTITVDILVIREGDKLKIKVPSIVFRANFPDFVGLDQETLARNAKVVARIAASLNKFKEYQVQIEGFANSAAKITGASAAAAAAEEQKELIPLSLGRAELVKKLLVQNGVDEKRLTTAGLGSSSPVVDFQDAQNRWKNRRVEFILIKKQ